LRDILNTACNITNTTYKGVGVGGWRGKVGGLMMPSDTDDQLQVVCTVGQTDGHTCPHCTMRRADIKWNSLGPQATLLMHPSGPTGSVLVLCGLIGLAIGTSLLCWHNFEHNRYLKASSKISRIISVY